MSVEEKNTYGLCISPVRKESVNEGRQRVKTKWWEHEREEREVEGVSKVEEGGGKLKKIGILEKYD